MFYIAFNMIRAGVARHPEDWKHSGYHELIGKRQRYRIINLPRFLNCLMAGDDVDGFRKWYESAIDNELSSTYHARERHWTEALAVGDQVWLEGYP